MIAYVRCVVTMASLAIAACGADRDAPPANANLPEATSLHRPLTRALGGEPATLNPRFAEDNAALALMQDLYEGLTAEAADGSIVPGAAATWSVSDDGRTWTFRLRENLRWSNGTPLTAAQYVAGLDAARAEDSQAPYSALLQDVTSTRATDSRTVVLEMARAVTYLPAVLALPVAAPQHLAASADVPVIGNGPYRLLARRPGEKIELERNPHYHSAGSVAIEHVTYLTLEDLNTELNLYRSGALDITSEVPNTQVGWLQQNLPGELHIAPYLSTYGYAFNLARMRDQDARVALSMAVDRGQITGQVTAAGEQPAYGWVPAGVPGYTPAQFTWTALPGAERIEQARLLWRAARGRRAAPDRLRLCTDASANHRRTAIALADQWRAALDVDVELLEMEWKAYLARREDPGDCDLLRFGWSADFIDAEAFLALFESGHSQNVSGYKSARYDALLGESRLVRDGAQRASTMVLAEQLLLAESPVIPVFHRVSKLLAKPDIEGVAVSPLGHLATRHLRFKARK